MINADKVAQQVPIKEAQGRRYRLHPVHRRIAAGAKYDTATGTFSVPARSAVVFVEE